MKGHSIPWHDVVSTSVRTRRDNGALTPGPRSVPSISAAQFTHDKEPPPPLTAQEIISEHSGPPESSSAWFSRRGIGGRA